MSKFNNNNVSGLGDIIVADGTGVLCIPLEYVKQVLESSEEYTKDDKQAMLEMDKGLSFIDALAKFKKI